jgi:predicted NAD/FAD-binding protein
MIKKIAIIGGGIAGLTAAYVLREKYDITLFEKSDRLGGNAYTLTLPDGEEVDIATAVFGKFSYKNLFRLFKKLNIDTVRAFRMNPFNVSGPGISYYNLDTKHGMFFTPELKGLIAQHFEILRPDHIMSVLQLMHGLKSAQTAARRGDLEGLTIEEALKKIPQLQGEAKLMFIGCLCLITSMHCNEVLDAPAGFFIEKLKVYNDVIPPTPRSLRSLHLVKNGTKSYVRALSAPYRDGVILNSKIKTVKRQDARVLVLMEDGRELLFDKVVFACNADQALQLLQEPTRDEQRLLGAWKYSEGNIVVHADHARFPKRELMEGFTFLYQDRGRYIETSVSGSLRALPNVSKKNNLISTQHPNFPIASDRMVFEKVFRTPIFDFKSCPTIRELPSLNGVKNTYYCGSHFGFGLHEDAVTSAIEVARRLDVHF